MILEILSVIAALIVLWFVSDVVLVLHSPAGRQSVNRMFNPYAEEKSKLIQMGMKFSELELREKEAEVILKEKQAGINGGRQ